MINKIANVSILLAGNRTKQSLLYLRARVVLCPVYTGPGSLLVFCDFGATQGLSGSRVLESEPDTMENYVAVGNMEGCL